MPLHIVPYYAAILALLYILLSLHVIRGRGRFKVALGSSNNSDLERRIRVHGNFAEYVPFTLLLLVLLELRDPSPFVLHGLSLCLVAGRLSHAWGVSRPVENFRFRVSGMILTFTALGGAALAIIFN